MSFPFNVYTLAWLSSFLVTAGAMPLWMRVCRRWGLVDDPGHRKIHSEPILLAGGLSVLTGLLLPILAAALWTWLGHVPAEALRHGLARRGAQLSAILLGAVAMALLGLADDKWELPPGRKFLGQFLIALLVAISGVRITLFVPNLPFSFFLTILWILTITNAVNFLDNMNGLSSGVAMLGAWAFGWTAAIQGQYLVALIAFLACGAVAGFLPYNFPKARVFLGDSGSHLLGFLLAVLAILPHFYSAGKAHRWAVLSPLLILAVPLLDLSWVVLYRTVHKRPFYVGDTNHLSHKLVRAGLTKTDAVLVLWLLTLLGSISALILISP
jgi:UDP-GlcNAc:undecaprenyl-phosphate/decaprenyl-phosphate GlcNAc-1-phosphate transferase